jgi:hypothetical protein
MAELQDEKLRKETPEWQSVNVGIPEGAMIAWIKKELNDEGACLTLPLAVLVVIFFGFLVLGHMDQSFVLETERSIEDFMDNNANYAYLTSDTDRIFGFKSMKDVTTISDFYSWLRLGLVPLVSLDQWEFSESSGLNDVDHGFGGGDNGRLYTVDGNGYIDNGEYKGTEY